jgi:hypothetical protein
VALVAKVFKARNYQCNMIIKSNSLTRGVYLVGTAISGVGALYGYKHKFKVWCVLWPFP